MSWMEKLYQTYEQSINFETFKPWPISHFVKTAHIEIVIDENGVFKDDRLVLLSGEDASTLIPATEESAGKAGSKIAPHPLSDELSYCAADLPNVIKERNLAYLNQLENWCLSDYSHPKVKAIYKYLSKGCLWADLSKNISFPLTFTSKSGQKTKVEAEKVFVRWRIEENGNACSATWEDDELIKNWIDYDQATNPSTGICFVTGKNIRLIENHPRFIRNSSDGAKLISSNDSNGYTYRGKFLNKTEAYGIGFEISQKAHNALRCLISRQSFRNGDQVFVSWAVSGVVIPELLTDSWSFLGNSDFDFEVDETFTAENNETLLDHSRNLGQSYALKLRNYIAGYAAKLEPNEQIIIMGIDSATPGRMGIVYYRELYSQDFINRIESWHNEFSWPQRHTIEVDNNANKKITKVIWPVSSPLPKDIIFAAYGETVDDNLKKNVIERLIPCIIDKQTFPIDLVTNCIRRATNRNAYASDKKWLWEKNLAIACALYKGYYHRHPNLNQRREYAMALEENYNSRDYLYGRLLAVAERIEEVALNISGESRSTTAARLMQRFADRPFETWRNIELALQPYMQRLRVSRAGFLANQVKELDKIKALFKNPDEFSSKERLSGEFLLGYHCQRHYFKNKSEVAEETTLQGDTE